ncbi:Pkinase-domain-containing protein [Annulohypoxylon bovei var. microspora]|nr:Pkinase-domain-containing protein [Annulohypoxylon bovei var. microspora]
MSLVVNMAGQDSSTSRPSRPPLGDATARVINTHSARPSKLNQPQIPQPNPLGAHPTYNHAQQHASPTTGFTSKLDQRRALSGLRTAAPPAALTIPVVQAVPQDVQQDTKRESQVLTSIDSYGKRRKTHVGPWELGKTLGAGSAARVRLVRHKFTGELAAVKILSRDVRHNTQPGSIAELDVWDRSRKEYETENRIPFTIEREVAIMKLIDHPNIVKLYDIWENHSEIYLVLEYVKCGDFYGYLDDHGRLSEAEAMFFFRQIVSALEYVHSFNICHRDLKPENILITENNQLKLTDFGMSALHQSPHHMLKTSCGSPHYAAPELIGPGCYRGDKADIWSLGVILYASLIHALPFNDDRMPRLLAKVEKAQYEMFDWVSAESQDLIAKVLEPDPEKRLSACEIWDHPLVRKHDYLDDYNDGGRARDCRHNARYDPVPAEELDTQALRQLKSVWHTYSEQQLTSLLMEPEPNEFKLFYWLLCSYREERMENYSTDLAYSASDFHHLQPPNWKKKYTTVEFPAQSGRSLSRFTVISNVATDEDGGALERVDTESGDTVKSYDPYRSSFVIDDVVASQAKVTVHRNGTSSTRTSRAPSVRSGSARTSSSTYSRRGRGSRHMKVPSTRRNSRHSLTSIKSGEEISYKRPAPIPKRGVEFSRAQRQSVDQGRPTSIVGDGVVNNRHVSCPESPSKRAKLSKSSGRGCSGTQSMADVSQVKADGVNLTDEFSQFSCSIAKDCDEAFNNPNSSYLTSTPLGSPDSENTKHIQAGIPSPTTTLTIHGAGNVNISLEPWDARSQPPMSSPRNLVMHDYITAQKRADRISAHMPESPGQESSLNPYGSPAKTDADRRIVSAPLYSQHSAPLGKDMSFLPSINEASREDGYYRDGDKPRVVSAPESSMPLHPPTEEGEGLEYLASQGNTIRVIYSPSHQASKTGTPSTPGTKPNPQVRPGLTLRQKYVSDGIQTSVPNESLVRTREGSFATTKKKSSWFKRGSKDKAGIFGNLNLSNTELDRTDSSSSSYNVNQPAKKKSFGFGWLRGSKEQRHLKLSLAGPDYDDSTEPERARTFSNLSQPPHGKGWDDKLAARNIEPQRNWLARLFRVKPATKYLCFSLSRRRGRQEISILLKQWRRHGMRDIVVDRERNLVFARVAKKNQLNLKEASFAAEVMTVIEHGNRNQLCIVRFTQERGAASTFNKVVDTMEEVFGARGMLVTDKYKAKMMIKTLNS